MTCMPAGIVGSMCGNWAAHCKSCYTIQLQDSKGAESLTHHCCMHCNKRWGVTMLPTCTTNNVTQNTTSTFASSDKKCLQFDNKTMSLSYQPIVLGATIPGEHLPTNVLSLQPNRIQTLL